MNIGIVGIGNMGLAIALRLRERGHTVEVRDVDHAREVLAMQVGCRAASDPADLARRCDLVMVVVVDAPQTREVVLGQRGLASVAWPEQCTPAMP